MNIKSSLILLFFFLITGPAFAIDPVYEGPNGIREQVFATNCLACHASNLTGSARNGAPPDVNWDTYEATRPNAERAIVTAVEEMTMPPIASGPLLNEDQRTAMLAWQSAGFPRDAITTAGSTDASFDGTRLRIPVVNIGNQKFNATLRLIQLENSPTGNGFVLENAALTTASSSNPATADPATGKVFIPSVTVIQNGIDVGTVDIQLTLIPGSDPMTFSLDNRLTVPTDASYSFNTTILNLPVVIVGGQKFRANLRLVSLGGSPTGLGFVLESAALTSASSDTAATANTATGLVIMPYVELIRDDIIQSAVRAEMRLIPGSNPLLFNLIRYTEISRM
ncbi:c-type cytochrome [Methylobacter sp. YRD-M1]|uniref:c-type cytochrome n=1 Tax=Methylobacter sp. YRD-M1 TaxID=2911520 RepID=UPI00227C6D8C|nr:c-type cytochrome [Methylobacter sp. YRD-M1]WAK00954.1 hypothetical protein LZ558_14040 [Methylobacter sp. YRD-M1]